MQKVLTTLRDPRGLIELIEDRDDEGWSVVHGRTIDTIGRLLREGFITVPAAKAAARFRSTFAKAGMEQRVTARYDGMPISARAGTHEDADARYLTAREEIHAVVMLLGGYAAPAALAVWHVIGNDLSINAWAQRQRWGRNTSLNRHAAQGMLVAALSVLAIHYGYEVEGA